MVSTSLLMVVKIGKNLKFILITQLDLFSQLTLKLVQLIILYGFPLLEISLEMEVVEFGNQMTLEIIIQKNIKLILNLNQEELRLK